MTLPKAWIEKAPLVMATKMCVGPERLKVRFILREEPNNPTDSGWVFFSGFEPEGYKLAPSDKSSSGLPQGRAPA